MKGLGFLTGPRDSASFRLYDKAVWVWKRSVVSDAMTDGGLEVYLPTSVRTLAPAKRTSEAPATHDKNYAK
eukprot:4790675-Amphidinium_carterae.1